MTTLHTTFSRILSSSIAIAIVLTLVAIGMPELHAAGNVDVLSPVELSPMHSRLVLPEPATVLASSMAALVIFTHYTLRRKQARKQSEE